jgi:hypothetical protein
MTKQSRPERLTLKEAAQYVNDRLKRKWRNPISALEANVYRGKIQLSAHGRENNKRTFTTGELERFIEAKNTAIAPSGGQPRKDLSKFAHLFGYRPDSFIANLAGCSPITVMRHRKAHGIPNFREAGKARIEAIKDRLGKEPAGRLAAEIRVNRMTVVRYMASNDIPAYRPRRK